MSHGSAAAWNGTGADRRRNGCSSWFRRGGRWGKGERQAGDCFQPDQSKRLSERLASGRYPKSIAAVRILQIEEPLLHETAVPSHTAATQRWIDTGAST
jgi:hypothetical protein